ncbi:MAG: tetratricopeptide repeat protein, partial [Candidatus Krumholzibacteria bacterium]|nr:tetratricopeptide repeat protein [Candidatus Krumholzibacteria bacterium]
RGFWDGNYLMARGRFEEAIAEAKRTLQLDPVSPRTIMPLAYIYRTARQYENAIAQFRKAAELEPNDPHTYSLLAWTYEAMEMYEDAVRARKKWMTLWGTPETKARIAALDSAYSESGPEGYWRWRLERNKGKYDRHPTYLAAYRSRRGKSDRAFAWLEKAYEKHDGEMHLLKVKPEWDPLRDDPRYHDLVRRMNFPENDSQEYEETQSVGRTYIATALRRLPRNAVSAFTDALCYRTRTGSIILLRCSQSRR